MPAKKEKFKQSSLQDKLVKLTSSTLYSGTQWVGGEFTAISVQITINKSLKLNEKDEAMW